MVSRSSKLVGRIPSVFEPIEKPIYTHFLSLPLKSKQLLQAYAKLQGELIQAHGETLNQLTFANAHMLHITVMMLDLRESERLEAARTLLYSLEEEINNEILNRSA